jgi:hypothetical protein
LHHRIFRSQKHQYYPWFGNQTAGSRLSYIGVQRNTCVTILYNIYPFINIYIWTGVKIPSWQPLLEPPFAHTKTQYLLIHFTFAPWINNGPGIWSNLGLWRLPSSCGKRCVQWDLLWCALLLRNCCPNSQNGDFHVLATLDRQ